MRISVVAGDRSVFIKIKGNSAKKLARAEAAAARLLPAEPAPAPAKPFGFGVTSDHEQAEPSTPHLGDPHV